MPGTLVYPPAHAEMNVASVIASAPGTLVRYLKYSRPSAQWTSCMLAGVRVMGASTTRCRSFAVPTWIGWNNLGTLDAI
jgi:hypothetical protein